MNVLEIAKNVCESYIPNIKRYVFSPSRIHSFAAEIRKQTLMDASEIESEIEQLTKERDDLITEAVKILAITNAEQDEYENELSAIKKERDLSAEKIRVMRDELDQWADDKLRSENALR